MTKIITHDQNTLTVAFNGASDLVVAAKVNMNGWNEGSSTFLYGSGKMSMMGNSTPQQDSLVYALTPLAHEDALCEHIEPVILREPSGLYIPAARTPDKIGLWTTKDGSSFLHISGQDLGFESRATLAIWTPRAEESPTLIAFHNAMMGIITQWGDTYFSHIDTFNPPHLSY